MLGGEAAGGPHDLAIITVSTNEARWLRPCLSTLSEHVGPIRADVVVVDNASTDGTRALVEGEFGWARVVDSANHGFAHGNNRGLATTDARYVLFLNPDTETVSGCYADLVAEMDARPSLGLVGVRQVDAQGGLWPTIRRFPTPLRAWCEALGSERWPVHPAWAGQRVLDRGTYDRDTACDWTSGSFMLVRREALDSAGWMDERFFLYSEEVDLCHRIKAAGWEVRHLPSMTIVHHAGKAGANPRLTAQEAFSARLYARKHFGWPGRVAFLAAVAFGLAVRASTGPAERRAAARRGLRVLLGREGAPYQPPPQRAVRPRVIGTGRRGCPRRSGPTPGS